MAKKHREVTDPFLRACTACGALAGQPCTTGADSKPLVPRATRLVHAARLEQGAPDA